MGVMQSWWITSLLVISVAVTTPTSIEYRSPTNYKICFYSIILEKF
jgi:hypothetical protein